MAEKISGIACNIYKQAAISQIVQIQRDNDLVGELASNLFADKFANTADYCLLLYGAALTHPGNKASDQFINDTLSDIEYRSRKKVKDVLKPYDAAYRETNPDATLNDVYLYPLTQAVESGDVTVMDGLIYALVDNDAYKPFVNAYKSYDEYTLLMELKRLYPKAF